MSDALARHVVSGQKPTADNATEHRLLSAEQVADRWQVPRAQVYRLARGGRVPVVSIGRYKRFRLQEIEAFESAGGAAANE